MAANAEFPPLGISYMGNHKLYTSNRCTILYVCILYFNEKEKFSTFYIMIKFLLKFP